MKFAYQQDREYLNTERGQKYMEKCRIAALQIINRQGVASAGEIWEIVSGSSFDLLNALDYLAETGAIKELTKPDTVWGQNRIYGAEDNA